MSNRFWNSVARFALLSLSAMAAQALAGGTNSIIPGGVSASNLGSSGVPPTASVYGSALQTNFGFGEAPLAHHSFVDPPSGGGAGGVGASGFGSPAQGQAAPSASQAAPSAPVVSIGGNGNGNGNVGNGNGNGNVGSFNGNGNSGNNNGNNNVGSGYGNLRTGDNNDNGGQNSQRAARAEMCRRMGICAPVPRANPAH